MADFIYKTIQDGNINELQFDLILTDKIRKFHNWIKQKIILESKNLSKGTKLLDVAVGRGGDIFKWSNARFKFVTGFDLDSKSIYEKNDFEGAIQRYCNVKHQANTPKCFFWNLSATDPFILNKLNSKDNNLIYDVVSCQFSFHYFVDDIDIVLNMISKKLKRGGIFIGTAADGDLIKLNLKNNNIDKNFLKINKVNEDIYSFNLISEKNKRETYFEYKGFSKEYFVLKEKLIEKCKKFGLYPKSIVNFYEWNKNYKGEPLTNEEMVCSFLNFSFIFEKV